MASRANAIQERFFNTLISGDRLGARRILDEIFDADASGESVAAHLVWPVLDQIQTMRRADQIDTLAYNYATRLLRSVVDQLQLRYEQRADRDLTAVVVCGAEESEELTGQLAADLLEADGYRVLFIGGGVANDEIVAQLAAVKADRLVVFGATPQVVPATRLMIDHLHDIGACENLQVIVGGGVFNRAEGLAEEIGADLWASDPISLVEEMAAKPERRMDPAQRTVGRRKAA